MLEACQKNKKLLVKFVQSLKEAGLSEAISWRIDNRRKIKTVCYKESNITRLDWPMSEERSVLRMNLISGLLDDISYNTARKIQRLLYMKLVGYSSKKMIRAHILPQEIKHATIAISGIWEEKIGRRKHKT